ncbi:hypothetical protein [Streptomyces sp. NPDC001876]|uniref:hypothetical protein n=1 Tax=Streptomyces sp. NPDC001876 TaxID=3154402 RepID=UPI003321B11A
MRNTLKKLAVTTGVASAALALGATQAMAFPATTWTVTSNPAAFTASSTSVILSVNSIPMTCTTAAASGSAFSATGNPANIASITAATFGTTASPCTSSVGPVTPVTTMPWGIWAEDYDTAAGKTVGHIKNIKAKLKVLTCEFTVEGSVYASYVNSTKKLTATSTKILSSQATQGLKVTTVTAGCTGLIAVGMVPTFNAVYSVNGITSIVGT